MKTITQRFHKKKEKIREKLFQELLTIRKKQFISILKGSSYPFYGYAKELELENLSLPNIGLVFEFDYENIDEQIVNKMWKTSYYAIPFTVSYKNIEEKMALVFASNGVYIDHDTNILNNIDALEEILDIFNWRIKEIIKPFGIMKEHNNKIRVMREIVF